ncbi:MAG: hypothetical protein GY943_28545 [Chloroflexi bacterium]|nr:hypothetical protein [Chloroflexota bacterium]
MLEIFRVPDSVDLDRFIETQGDGLNPEKIYLGAITLENHMLLVKYFPELQHIPYFEDTHLNAVETARLHKMCNDILIESVGVQNPFKVLNDFNAILGKAFAYSEGIIALCD